MMGDSLVSAQPVPCTLTVQGGAGAEAQFYTAHGLAARSPVTEDRQRFEFRADPASSRYVRAQLVEPDTGHCRAVTNPIYLSSPA